MNNKGKANECQWYIANLYKQIIVTSDTWTHRQQLDYGKTDIGPITSQGSRVKV